MPWNGFKNKAKVLGSPMFDAEFLGNKEILIRVGCTNKQFYLQNSIIYK